MNEISLTGHVSIYSVPDPQIYANLIRKCIYLRKEGEFSTCFTELQRNFLKQRPTKVKSLIRLVKYWYHLVRHLTQALGTSAGQSVDIGQRKCMFWFTFW